MSTAGAAKNFFRSTEIRMREQPNGRQHGARGSGLAVGQISFYAAACYDGSLTMDVGVASRKRRGPGKGSNAGDAEAIQENRRRDLKSPSRTNFRFRGLSFAPPLDVCTTVSNEVPARCHPPGLADFTLAAPTADSVSLPVHADLLGLGKPFPRRVGSFQCATR